MRSPFIAQNPAWAIGLRLRLAAIKSYGAPRHECTRGVVRHPAVLRQRPHDAEFVSHHRTLGMVSFEGPRRVESRLRPPAKELRANFFYIPGEHLFGDEGEGSTGGSPPNDLGLLRQTGIFAKVLEPLLPTTK